jgi:hypothetical protein
MVDGWSTAGRSEINGGTPLIISLSCGSGKTLSFHLLASAVETARRFVLVSGRNADGARRTVEIPQLAASMPALTTWIPRRIGVPLPTPASAGSARPTRVDLPAEPGVIPLLDGSGSAERPWARFGDLRNITRRLLELERRLTSRAEPGALFATASPTDIYRQGRGAVTSASWWRAVLARRKAVRTLDRILLRRICIALRRRIGIRNSFVASGDDETCRRIDHSVESHRSRAPGSARKTLISTVFRGLAPA